MQKEAGKSVWWWVIGVSFSFVIGYLMASDSSEVKRLRAELAQLNQNQNETHPQDLRVRANAVAPKPVSAGQPVNTSGDIASRRRQGEYFLQNEQPYFRKNFDQHMSELFSVALSNNAVTYSNVF